MLEPLRMSDRAHANVSRARGLTQDFRPAGKFVIEHFDANGNLKGKYDVPNGIVDVGLNHILETEFRSGAQITTWYIGLIDNSPSPTLAAADTMGSHAGWAESTAYDEATRPTWSPGAAASRQITNGTTVDFTMNATATIKGIFITSNNTKGGTTGTLWSTAAFGSTVSVADNDVLKVTYTLSG